MSTPNGPSPGVLDFQQEPTWDPRPGTSRSGPPPSLTHRDHRADMRAAQSAHRAPTPAQGPARHVAIAQPPRAESESLHVDLERADARAADGGDAGIFRSRSPTNSVTSEDKPRAEHAEHARGRAGGRDASSRRPMFSRTFTQQFRAAHLADVDFKSLSQRDKRAVVGQGLRSYFMDTNVKNHVVAAMGEFVGTTMFLFFAFSGTGVANIPAGSTDSSTTTVGVTGFDTSKQIYIALCFGFSLMVNVWVFYRISGGLFNPAVTLALLLIKAITPIRAVFVLTAQLLGGIAAAGLASCLFPTALNVSTSLAPGVSLAQGVFTEAVLTFELVFTIFMLAAEKHRATFVAPVGIGLALFVAELTGVYYTGGSLNPARSLGPCVVAAYFQPEHWIYWVGPFFGSLVAVAFYKVIKALRYEGVNPGQDSNE